MCALAFFMETETWALIHSVRSDTVGFAEWCLLLFDPSTPHSRNWSRCLCGSSADITMAWLTARLGNSSSLLDCWQKLWERAYGVLKIPLSDIPGRTSPTSRSLAWTSCFSELHWPFPSHISCHSFTGFRNSQVEKSICWLRRTH